MFVHISIFLIVNLFGLDNHDSVYYNFTCSQSINNFIIYINHNFILVLHSFVLYCTFVLYFNHCMSHRRFVTKVCVFSFDTQKSWVMLIAYLNFTHTHFTCGYFLIGVFRCFSSLSKFPAFAAHFPHLIVAVHSQLIVNFS